MLVRVRFVVYSKYKSYFVPLNVFTSFNIFIEISGWGIVIFKDFYLSCCFGHWCIIHYLLYHW